MWWQEGLTEVYLFSQDPLWQAIRQSNGRNTNLPGEYPSAFWMSCDIFSELTFLNKNHLEGEKMESKVFPKFLFLLLGSFSSAIDCRVQVGFQCRIKNQKENSLQKGNN